MKKFPPILATTAMWVAGCCLVSGSAQAAQPQPAAGPHGDTDIETQLEAARMQLERAAKEVARLSMQVGNPLFEQAMTRNQRRRGSAIGVEIATEAGPDGARVLDVSPGGAAAEGGVRAGDVIAAINGTQIKGDDAGSQVVQLIDAAQPDSKLKVRVMRNGKPEDLVVVPRAVFGYEAYAHTYPWVPPYADAPGVPRAPVAPLVAGNRGRVADRTLMMGWPATAPIFSAVELANMQFAVLTPQLGRYFGTEKGVLVLRAPPGPDFKLQDGDVILSIDGREPTSAAHAMRILASYQPGEKIALRIMRDRKPVDLDVKLPDGQQVTRGAATGHLVTE
jgi:predicted metalloprotease with PDZ domain